MPRTLWGWIVVQSGVQFVLDATRRALDLVQRSIP